MKYPKKPLDSPPTAPETIRAALPSLVEALENAPVVEGRQLILHVETIIIGQTLVTVLGELETADYDSTLSEVVRQDVEDVSLMIPLAEVEDWYDAIQLTAEREISPLVRVGASPQFRVLREDD